MLAIGIIIESCVQAIATHFLIGGDHYQKIGPKVRGWARVIGYIWTAGFLVWTTPAYSYPAIQEEARSAEKTMLPFSVVKTVYMLLPGRA